MRATIGVGKDGYVSIRNPGEGITVEMMGLDLEVDAYREVCLSLQPNEVMDLLETLASCYANHSCADASPEKIKKAAQAMIKATEGMLKYANDMERYSKE